MWDTALKFFIPVLRITSPDHLVERGVRFYNQSRENPSLKKTKKTNKQTKGKKKNSQISLFPGNFGGRGGDFGFIAITALLESSLSTDGYHSASIYSNHEASFFLFPLSWIAKLLVTPSKLVLFTGVGLLGVCCFILLIILVLYLKEKVSYLLQDNINQPVL